MATWAVVRRSGDEWPGATAVRTITLRDPSGVPASVRGSIDLGVRALIEDESIEFRETSSADLYRCLHELKESFANAAADGRSVCHARPIAFSPTVVCQPQTMPFPAQVPLWRRPACSSPGCFRIPETGADIQARIAASSTGA